VHNELSTIDALLLEAGGRTDEIRRMMLDLQESVKALDPFK
jgi:hypothetical protein